MNFLVYGSAGHHMNVPDGPFLPRSQDASLRLLKVSETVPRRVEHAIGSTRQVDSRGPRVDLNAYDVPGSVPVVLEVPPLMERTRFLKICPPAGNNDIPDCLQVFPELRKDHDGFVRVDFLQDVP